MKNKIIIILFFMISPWFEKKIYFPNKLFMNKKYSFPPIHGEEQGTTASVIIRK